MWPHLKAWDKKQGKGCIADRVNLNRKKPWEMARGGAAAAALPNKKKAEDNFVFRNEQKSLSRERSPFF